MKKPQFIAATLCLALLAACSSKEEVKQEELALQAAKTYYDQLLQGDCDSFLEGTLQGDSLPPAYRDQLLLNTQMYLEKQRKNHGGISEVRTLSAKLDNAKQEAEAFLSVVYADSTKERILVPMLKKDGIWYMR